MPRVIVITGAGAGLGRALARRFAADGDAVVLLGVRLGKVQAVADELGDRALALACDVGSPDSVRAAFDTLARTHSRIDVLINNAAVYQPFLVAEATDAQILQTIATNLTGPILCARAAIPSMTRGAHIINVGSESVAMTFPHLVLYQTSKAGLERFSLALQHELEDAGIKVTLVRAGSMFEEGKTWDVDPEARARFAEAAKGVGIDLRERARTHYRSIVEVFRALIDLPDGVQAGLITLHARPMGEPGASR